MSRLYWVFFLMCLAGFAGVVLSISQVFGLRPGDGATFFAGLLAGAIVWWQGHLIRQQMQLQAIIELDKEWNSKEMLANRNAAWTDKNEPEKDSIEDALEFLEKVSTFEKHGVISADLIWETFGWYLWRYFYYSSSVIEDLRKEWTPAARDLTLYEDLEGLYRKLLIREVKRRNRKNGNRRPLLTQQDVISELDTTKEKFIRSERRLTS